MWLHRGSHLNALSELISFQLDLIRFYQRDERIEIFLYPFLFLLSKCSNIYLGINCRSLI